MFHLPRLEPRALLGLLTGFLQEVVSRTGLFQEGLLLE
jgi:hypothetical protein